MEAEDVLADDVDDALPVAGDVGRAGLAGRSERVTERGEVVGERVEPHVHDVLAGLAGVARVVGHRDAPGEARPGDGQIAQPAAQEAEHLVPVLLGLDEVRVTLDVRGERVAVRRELEEVRRLLGHPAHRALVHGAHRLVGRVLLELAVGVEGLAADAVPALVGGEVQVLRVLLQDALPEALHDPLVTRLGGADEVAGEAVRGLRVVEAHAEVDPRLAEARRDLIGERLRREPALLGGLDDLLAVLVRAGQEARVVAAHVVEARERVGDDRRVRVAQVGDVVDVVDGGGDVEGTGHDSSGSGSESGSGSGSGSRPACWAGNSGFTSPAGRTTLSPGP